MNTALILDPDRRAADPADARTRIRSTKRAAPWIATIHSHLAEREERHAAERAIAFQRQNSRREKYEDAARTAGHMRAALDSNPNASKADIARVESAEAEAESARKAWQAITIPAPLSGLKSAMLETAAERLIRGGVRPIPGLKTATADPAKLAAFAEARAAIFADIKTLDSRPVPLADALAHAMRDVTRAVQDVAHRWPASPYLKPEVDARGRTRPRVVGMPKRDDGGLDVVAILLTACEPLIRAALEKKITALHDAKHAFDGELSAKERDGKRASFLEKLRKIEADECAVIRALAMAGKCPEIRADVDLVALFGVERAPAESPVRTEPDPTSREAAEADAEKKFGPARKPKGKRKAA